MIDGETPNEIYYHIREGNFTILQGDNSLDFLNRITTNMIQKKTDGKLNLTLLCGASGRIEDSLEVIFSEEGVIVIGLSTNGEKIRQKLVQGKNWNERINVLNGDDPLTFLTIYGQQLTEIAKSFNLEINHDETQSWFEINSKLIRYNNTQPASIDLILQTESLGDFFDSGIETSLKISSINSWNKFCIDNSILQYNEIKSSPLPFECGLGHLIDPNKGCYPGQEIHARIESRGKQTKFITKFVANTQLQPGKYRSEDGKKIMITTVSIIEDKTYGIAIIPTHFLGKNEIRVNDNMLTKLHIKSF
jgi:folate-binding protein YgfZ